MPEPDVDDLVDAAMRVVAKSVPVAGQAIAEILSFAETPLSIRKQHWFESIAARLTELEGEVRDFKIASLSNNPTFMSSFLTASAIAIKTHQQEKLDALRNAVINAALTTSPDEDLQLIFLNLIDTFTQWHIRILKFYQNPKRWFKEHNQDPVYRGNSAQSLVGAFPDLRSNQILYEQIVTDLNIRGLLSLDKTLLQAGMTEYGLDQSRTTEMGNEFLQFIAST
ncbi:MAG TPA: hypothetical protein PKZ65_01915 [Methanoregulaceae archaeon]|nr:hypothetical protein [Methanoregulaceae archaeon]